MVQAARIPKPLVTGLVAALLAVHAWLALSATIDLGVTGDETAHLTGGYSYWRFDDYRLHPENGNLPQRWAALPLLAMRPRLEPQDWPNDWRHSDIWMAGQHFFFDSGNSIDFILLCARAATLFWSLATGLLVFFWARALWGEIGALLSLTLFALSPTALAHGALVTSDMCATFWLLAATGAWWRLTERFDAIRLTTSLVAAGMAVVAKYSGLLLLPIAILILAWRVSRPHPIDVSWGNSRRLYQVKDWRKRLGLLSTAALVHLLTTAGMVWLFFGFRYSAFNPALPRAEDFFSSFDGMLAPDGAVRWLLLHARQWHALPEAFLQGLAYVIYGARERPAFLAGEYANRGWWWFFPFAFLVKSSAAELVAVASLAAAAALRWYRAGTEKVFGQVERIIPLLCLAAVYGAFSISSHLNIGQRHILPLYPVLFIVAGTLGRTGTRWAGTVLGIAIAGIASVEAGSTHPNYLSFFNQLAGGSKNGWRLLGDSSLDWGQNLPRLAAWLEEHQRPTEPEYLSYFGADDPYYRGIRAAELAPYFSFGRERRWERLRPGWYCIGASMLQDAASPYRGSWSRQYEATYQTLRHKIEAELASGVRSPMFGQGGNRGELELWNLDRARFARLCQYLRVRQPDAEIGHMIFIFHLRDDELRQTVEGSLTDLTAAIEAAAGRKVRS